MQILPFVRARSKPADRAPPFFTESGIHVPPIAGFGGLGQRPNPSTERGIETSSNTATGGIPGSVFPGKIDSGITSPIGEYTGAAPCWQCEPQPGWGNNVGNKSDYGTDRDKPNLIKGLN